jgi:hypothetical protein
MGAIQPAGPIRRAHAGPKDDAEKKKPATEATGFR